jgi:hypothetical protein
MTQDEFGEWLTDSQKEELLTFIDKVSDEIILNYVLTSKTHFQFQYCYLRKGFNFWLDSTYDVKTCCYLPRSLRNVINWGLVKKKILQNVVLQQTKDRLDCLDKQGLEELQILIDKRLEE